MRHSDSDCRISLTKKKRYEMAEPQIYRVGDIVEAQISFVAIPLKGQKYKMSPILHSIALIDGSFTTVREQ